MKLVTFEDDKILNEISLQFKLIETNVIALKAALDHEQAVHSALKIRYEALTDRFEKQQEELKVARQEHKNQKTEIKNLKEKELSFKEKLNNFKELSIIVKNPKNAGAITELNNKLDQYIRYIDEAIALLKTL